MQCVIKCFESSSSCEMDIHDLIGSNVYSAVFRKTLCFVCHLTSCILQMHYYSHMPPACGLRCFLK